MAIARIHTVLYEIYYSFPPQRGFRGAAFSPAKASVSYNCILLTLLNWSQMRPVNDRER